MKKERVAIGTDQKALTINLDPDKYGTVVEIGAGQEVARNFFSAGAAAGTIAKTMSAYDMQVSDEIYGRAKRYVGRERLEQMLAKEYDLLIRRLTDVRSKETTYFAYAATVAAKSYGKESECHAWVGVRLQLRPGEAPNDIILHVRMLDQENAAQSEALGILGVNLIFGAFYHSQKPKEIIRGLLDNIGQDRLDIDLIHFAGPAFPFVDNRLMNLQLIHNWCTRAVMFTADGVSVPPREVLYRKPVMVIRGSFKPVTKVHIDMTLSGLDQFLGVAGVDKDNTVTLAEITMAELVSGQNTHDPDFLSRVELLNAMGYAVLVSDYLRFFKLRSWLRQFTQNPIGIVLSVLDFDYLFDQQFYEGLEGGIMEAMGKLFPDNTHVYVYPARVKGDLVTLENVKVPEQHHYLLKYLVANDRLVPAEVINEEHLHISARELSQQIPQGHGDWEAGVPEKALQKIFDDRLFGYPGDND